MSDRELLELAAKAAGIEILRCRLDDPMWRDMLLSDTSLGDRMPIGWNPLLSDGDAIRLAVRLSLFLQPYTAYLNDDAFVRVVKWPQGIGTIEPVKDEGGAMPATRRAIVRAAAEIGKAMP